jgi:hypothetical protein
LEHLVKAVRGAVAESNWYAALSLALTLPDICGGLESAGGSRKRYVDWCDTYLVPTYTSQMDDGPYVFLGASDCYALRCALLHRGVDDITGTPAQELLDSFLFVSPPPWGLAHCNQSDAKLQLQVDIFCEDICVGVEKWLMDISAHNEVTAKMSQLMRITDITNGL